MRQCIAPSPWLRALAAVALLVTTSCSSDVAHEASGPVCPACSPSAGETSDFGLHPPPTPCELSRVSSAIDLAGARELGFGAALDMFDRKFSQSLEWTVPLFAERAGKASGYDLRSTVAVQLQIAQIELLTSSLAGCEQALQVTVDANLHTEDGSLAIAAPLRGWVNKTYRPSLFGVLDLATVTGTMRVTPAVDALKTVGSLGVSMVFWPDTTRGSLSVSLAAIYDDSMGPLLGTTLLSGAFPPDRCSSFMRPWKPEVQSPELAGSTPNQIRERLAASLRVQAPVKAVWSDGRETGVTVEVGAPTGVCIREGYEGGVGAERNARLTFEMKLAIRSEDGHVKIEGTAGARVEVAPDGAIVNAELEIMRNEPRDKGGLERSGIYGVDLGGAPLARWYAVVYFRNHSGSAPPSQVVVERIDAEGVIIGPATVLEWSLDSSAP